MAYTKATAVNTDLFFFIWQVYSRIHVRIIEKNILIEQGKLDEGWNCSGFDDWAYKYNKTDIFRNLIETALYFGLLDEVIVSIRELGRDESGHPEIMEIEKFEVNVDFLETFREGFPHHHNGNHDIYSKFELFFNGFYSLPHNSYALYFSYKINHKNINSFIEEYLIDWFQDKLTKPRNYIKPSIQVETFSDIVSDCNSIYGNDFEYLLGTNSKLDEATLVIYFQALGWLSIKEYDDGISPIIPVTGKEGKKFYLHLELKYFEYIQRKAEFHKNSEDETINKVNPFKINKIGEVYINNQLLESFRINANIYQLVKHMILNYGKPVDIDEMYKIAKSHSDKTAKDWATGYINKKNFRKLYSYLHNVGTGSYTLKNEVAVKRQ